MYKVVLDHSGEEYKATGKTVDEALVKMGLTWDRIKAKGVIKISKGKQSYEHVFTAIKLRRLFGNKLTRALWGKRLQFFVDSEKETNLPEKIEVKKKVKK